MTLKNAPVYYIPKLHISGFNIPILDYSHVNISYIIYVTIVPQVQTDAKMWAKKMHFYCKGLL